jgi:hypothetical protein
MKIKYLCKKTGKIGNCQYVIEVAHFKELIEKIEQHENNMHNEKI